MKRYELEIQQYDVYCELCNEYHQYVNCPLCDDGEVIEVYHKGKVASCENDHVFAVWEIKNKVVMVDCALTYRARFTKAKCDHSKCKYVVGAGHDACCEEGCPLLQ